MTTPPSPLPGLLIAAVMVTSGPSLAGDCFLDPPCTGTPEGEPCDEVSPDTTNGGCLVTPSVFGTLEFGEVICGTNWANGGMRDTDWYLLPESPTGPLWVLVELRAEAPSMAFLLTLGDDGALCTGFAPTAGTPAVSGACAETTELGNYVLEHGVNYALIVTTGDGQTGIFDGFPCPDGAATTNAYEAQVCLAPITIPNPYDLNGNCTVDFGDILVALAHWGACPTTEGVTIELRAEADTVAFLARMSAGGVCPVTGLADGVFAYSGDCDSDHILGTGYVLPPGDYAVVVGTGTAAGGGLLDGFPCPDGSTTNNAYEVSLFTTPVPLPCPWDLNDNNDVDFADILLIIANWQSECWIGCP
ncbi:MAG: hypothetical protein GY715_02520 [Planctomycetes bacterium]|nr:hypothetical protein [Planctomycetota bacterium]